jgi:hypothetical protein
LKLQLDYEETVILAKDFISERSKEH